MNRYFNEVDQDSVFWSIWVATRVVLVPFIGDGGLFLLSISIIVYKFKEELVMLDIKKVRANFDEVKEKLSKRGEDLIRFR